MISVITPFRDVAPYLEETIRSVLAQTRDDFEYLLVNDGSRDASPEIAERWAARDSRIRVFHRPAHGASAARNAGLDHARGEYLSFVDGDDRWRPDFLATLSALLDESPRQAIGAFGWSQTITPGGALTHHVRTVSLDRYDAFEMLLGICPPGNGSSLMFRREVFDGARFDTSLVSAQDSEMWQRILFRDRAGYVLSVSRVLTEYRMSRPGSLSATQMPARMRALDTINRRYAWQFTAAQRARISLRHAHYAGYNGFIGTAARLGIRALLAQPLTVLRAPLFWESLAKFARLIHRKRAAVFLPRPSRPAA